MVPIFPYIHILTNIAEHRQFVPAVNLKSLKYLNSLSEWAQEIQMKFDKQKRNYMIINLTSDYQLEGEILDEVKETRLLGLTLSSNLKWHSNTEAMVKMHIR